MEPWQRDHIQNNLVELIKNTKCNHTFTARLVSEKTLTAEEVEKMDSMSTSCEKSKLLYDILQTRCGAFNILLQAVEETQQSGVLEILKGYEPKYQKRDLITYDRNHILGKGSYGSIVYKGKFDERDVAVKVLSDVQINLAKAVKEVDFLKMLDDHENIIRYFYAEKYENFVYIALELFVINLQNEITQKLINLPASEILWKCTNGLAYLHSCKVLHRDLKPSNILLNRLNQVKISDFGLSKKIPDGETCVSVSGVVGTVDWMAPEIPRLTEQDMPDIEDIKMTTSSDIFSLGCIFYFVLSNGSHAFGHPMKRQYYIYEGHPQLDTSKVEKNWLNLIEKMIAHSPLSRPSAQDILTESNFSSYKSLGVQEQDIEYSKCTNGSENEAVITQQVLQLPAVNLKPDNTILSNLLVSGDASNCFEQLLKPDFQGQIYKSDALHHTVNTILSCKIQFLGKECTFQDIGIGEIDLREILKLEIYQDEIHEIVRNQNGKLYFANDMGPPPVEFHFPRKVSNVIHLDPKAYKESVNDIFVFKGFKMANLNSLVAPSGPTRSSSQLQEITSRFIFLEDAQHWEEMRKISQHPIHLVNTSYILEEISYSSDQIWKYMQRKYKKPFEENKTFTSLTEEEFLRKTINDKFVLICDSLGTGKSSYLKHLARQIKELFSNRIVIYEPLSLFTENIDFTQQDLLSLLCDRIGTSALSRAILTRLLVNKKLTIQIFLHDVNSTSIQKFHVTKKFVDSLAGEGLKVQVFITCGSYFRKELETLTNTSSYYFSPIQSPQDFIAGLWKFKINDPDETKLSNFARSCWMELRNMTQDDIIYNPFFCFRFAEVLLNEASKFQDNTERTSKNIIGTHNNYVFKIYKEFIDHSLNVLASTVKSDHSSGDTCTIEESYKSFYVTEALKIQFPDLLDEYACQKKFPFPERYVPFGILKQTTEMPYKPEFQHPSFAIFFIAEYFAEQLVKYDGNFIEYFVTKILSKLMNNIVSSEKTLIAYFVDQHLGQNLHLFCGNEAIKTFFTSVSPGEFFKVLHNIVFGNFTNLFKLLSNLLNNVEKSVIQKHKIYLRKSKLKKMEETCALLLKNCDVNTCIECFKLWHDVFEYNHFDRYKNTKNIPWALIYAYSKPDTKLLEYLLDKCTLEGKNLIPLYVEKSHMDTEEKAILRIKICNILLSKTAKLINECGNVLVTGKVNLQVLKYLIEKGINIFATYGANTLVYNCASYMSEEDYRALCYFLINDFKAVELFKPTFKWRGPLHLIFEENNTKSIPNVLHILDLGGININELDEDGNNLVLCAIVGRCDLTIIKDLISNGGNYMIRNKDGHNAIHLAVKYEGPKKLLPNVETVKHFISLNCGLSDKDTQGRTPLDLAVEAYDNHKHLPQHSNTPTTLENIVELLKQAENSKNV